MDPVEEASSLGFREYVRILWRRRWLVIALTAVAIGGSVAVSAVTVPVYQGSADLLLTPQLSSAVLQASSNGLPAPTVDVPTDLQIIEESSLQNLVRKTIPDAPAVSAAQIGTTNVVRLSVESTDPKLAARTANAYVNDYIRSQQEQAVDSLNAAAQVLQSHINSVQANINSIQDQISHAGTSDASGLTAQLNSLDANKSTLQEELSNYQFTALVDTGGGQVASVATVPTKPVKPKPLEYGGIAALVGIILGVALALILEFFDDAIRSKDDFERVGLNLPMLGLIPDIVDWRDAHAQYLVSRSAPKSAPAESYRSLRTSIQFLGLDRSIRILQFTSPSAAEGKTTTMANLGVVTAQAGLRVVMVCCDLRRPRLHEFFGISNQVGFTSVLLGESSLADALQPVAGLENLHVLASGPIPPNPSELLSGESTNHLLQTLAENADLVLIDSPPVLPVTDAAVLASRVDGVVLVAAVGTSTRSQVSRTLQTLTQVDAPMAGLVLNRASESDTYTYYRYVYGPPNERGESPRHDPSDPLNGSSADIVGVARNGR